MNVNARDADHKHVRCANCQYEIKAGIGLPTGLIAKLLEKHYIAWAEQGANAYRWAMNTQGYFICKNCVGNKFFGPSQGDKK